MTAGSKGLTLQAASLSLAAVLLAGRKHPAHVYDKFRCRGVALEPGPDSPGMDHSWIPCKTIALHNADGT